MEFKLAHPVQKYVCQKTEGIKVLHKKLEGDVTVCGWPCIKKGGHPRGKPSPKYTLCADCGFRLRTAASE